MDIFKPGPHRLDLSSVQIQRLEDVAPQEFKTFYSLRIFWAVSFCFGMFAASYFILNLWDKWESSPVYMSVETTSLAVPNIPFPAVSVCSVNKLEEKRLLKALEMIMRNKTEAEIEKYRA